MITYESSVVGFATLFRVHGSAVYKVILPSACSTCMILIYDAAGVTTDSRAFLVHPYAIGAVIAFFSLMLTFRLNFCYARYWEGATTITNMQSKWLDNAIMTAAFHYQAKHYDDIKPPSFGRHPRATAQNIRRRQRDFTPATWERTVEKVERMNQQQQRQQQQQQGRPLLPPFGTRKRPKPRTDLCAANNNSTGNGGSSGSPFMKTKSIRSSIPFTSQRMNSSNLSERTTVPVPQRFQERFHLPPTIHNGPPGASTAKMPSPFLQELAHLTSLHGAVALSTLRADDASCSQERHQVEPPLTTYIPEQPWPAADPALLPADTKRQFREDNALWSVFYFVLGLNRSKGHRRLFNAARPFGVLGGVSDDEMRMLQRARGSLAQVTLCEIWLKEFMSREYLAGSTGAVGGPILSRLYQIISDGAVGYNQARKVAHVPFPYPHAQITAFFSIVIIFMIPLLYYSYVNRLALACILNFASVLCFLGLHEVARELENPMQNAPNNLPLTTFQAQFNEALVTAYAGFHPDAWWELVTPNDNDAKDGEPDEGMVNSAASATIKTKNDEKPTLVVAENGSHVVTKGMARGMDKDAKVAPAAAGGVADTPMGPSNNNDADNQNDDDAIDGESDGSAVPTYSTVPQQQTVSNRPNDGDVAAEEDDTALFENPFDKKGPLEEIAIDKQRQQREEEEAKEIIEVDNPTSKDSQPSLVILNSSEDSAATEVVT